MPNPLPPVPSSALVAALRRVLRPLAKLMLNHGINFPFICELIKSVLVETAIKEFRLVGKLQTDSRISLLTGVHRKDVRRLRATSEEMRVAPERTVPLGAQLVALWVGDAAFLDENNLPRPLPRLASQGGEVSFERLVERVSKDIRPRSVLDEWLRLGVATLDEDDCVCLVADAFIPDKGFDEKAFYFGLNLGDHLSAGVGNLLGEKPPMLERSVHYDALSLASAEELALLSEKLAMQTLKAVNRRAMELERDDAKTKGAKYRMTMGTYFYRVQAAVKAEKPGGKK